MRFQAEYTDTMGGEANYSWVRRAEFSLPDDASDLQIVRRAKAGLGLTGQRCRRFDLGETIELRPHNACTVVFVSPIY
jgi:hypothetical protein